ncbi:MAG: hypothetical protein U0790_26340 [Isosphaeraceae bacterium]
MSPYKTIVLEFLKEHHPALHEQLRENRRLQRTVDAYATYLNSKHVAWRDSLLPTGQWGDASQVSSQALELALEDLRESLRDEFSSDETGPLSPGAARAFLRRHTPSS